jgi:hypothetical protein
LLIDTLKTMQRSNVGTSPSKEYLKLNEDELEEGDEDDAMKLSPPMKDVLSKVKYGSTEQGRMELRIASLEISLGHIHHHIHHDSHDSQEERTTTTTTTSATTSSFTKRMAQNEETSSYFVHASNRLAKCGQPLKAAQVRRDIQRLYMTEEEIKTLSTKKSNDVNASEPSSSSSSSPSSKNSSNKESEAERQVRYSNMAEHVIEAARLYSEARFLCQVMNNYKSKSAPLMSSDLFSSKFHRRVSMLTNWEVSTHTQEKYREREIFFKIPKLNTKQTNSFNRYVHILQC